MTAARPDFASDCANCFALCCVASNDFAITKAAGTPCPYLRPDFGCDQSGSQRERPLPGRSVFECFGAGSARLREEVRRQRVLAVTRQLQEVRLHLTSALTLG